MPLSGFATFKNEGEGEVEIVGVAKEEGSAAADLSGGSGMILSTQELQNGWKKYQYRSDDLVVIVIFSRIQHEF